MKTINFNSKTKGIGVSSIIKLVLAVMITSLFISMSTIGSLGDAMQHSFENVEDAGSQVVEIEDKQTLSDLYEFVRDRAVDGGCDVVEDVNDERGYPNLAGTYLTQEPPCFGGEAGLLRGTDGLNWGGWGADEEYMPGIYSRENFVIVDNITIEPGSEHTVLEGKDDGTDDDDYDGISFVATGSPQQNAEKLEIDGDGNIGPGDGAAFGGTVGGTAGMVAGPKGAAAGAGIGAVVGGGLGAISSFVDDTTIAPVLIFIEADDVDNRIYTEIGMDETDENEEIGDIGMEITLCEGDKGYVQSNRGDIDDISHNDGQPLVPIIVITEAEYENCGGRGDEVEERIETYDGPTTANQLFIRSGGGSTYEWRGADNFELLEVGDRRGNDWVRPYTDVGGDENQCEIYYHHDAGTGFDDGTTLRTYGLYKTVDKNQETFRDGGGFTYIDQAHRTEEGGGAHQNDRKINAYTLFNRISNDGDTDGTGLDGALINPPEASGQLRKQTSSGGFNELYGDLICANPDSRDYAEWHLCNENLADEKMEIRNTNYGAAEEYIDYSCDPSEGEWNRETGSHR